MSSASSSGLSIKRIAAYQQYSVPLVIVSETAQQTALALQEALIRESLERGLHVVAVCMESLASADIAQRAKVSLVDKRLSPEEFTAACSQAANFSSQIDFLQLENEINKHIAEAASSSRGSSSDGGVLVVFDSLDRLLHSSTVSTLVLLRSIRRALKSDAKSRILARYPRDTFAKQVEGNREAENGPFMAGTLSDLADAAIDVYPLDSLGSWMPGWYSDGRPQPFVSLGQNDPRRGLIRLEHKRQSGKVGYEVASFEISESGLPLFAPVSAAPAPVPLQEEDTRATAPQQPSSKPSINSAKQHLSSQDQKPSDKDNAEKQQPDPTANLSFNLNLTEKQRRDRANVELPYLEAQLADLGVSSNYSNGGSTGGGGGGGGEIHYQMDEEDDWDEDDPDDDLEI
ncbi:Elongator complex protein [Dipsacomyces acuminosporus]|nr:Elongator complex protein [Dipsacomyces acuminosporus]